MTTQTWKTYLLNKLEHQGVFNDVARKIIKDVEEYMRKEDDEKYG